ncbi:DUF1214 domain-containing protein [Nocardia asteroides]|uniref:DUF1214 domain-containing protein n=1 Tax=Nocardia asteroides TaxID=1824 RepID=UPI001E437EAA|nr:DUF1254 domain-containing protein [Nocardia asteroides]UGT58632.1 DUF1254 domain-containing protein [Nocardia asteroides]
MDRYRALAQEPLAGGYPTPQAAEALATELYFQRAVQTYLWALPAVNLFAMRESVGHDFGHGYNVMAVYEKRLKPNTVITTPNSDVIYGLCFVDLSQTGPLVVEAAPMVQGLVDDAWHRPLVGPEIDGVQYLADIGIPGPDQGKGGKYLIVREGEDPGTDLDDYFVYTSPTNGIYMLLRGFFRDVDDLAPGVTQIEGITLRPLNGSAQPMVHAHASDISADALFPRDFSYFQMLDRMIQGERDDQVDPYMHGVLAALGIRRGHSFAPTDRERELLDLAAKTAWRVAKTTAADFDTTEDALWWNDRHWIAHARTKTDDFYRTLIDEYFRDRQTGHTDVDAKAHMFINHFSISTGMMSVTPGKGAKYCNAYKDSDGNYLRGENTYRIDLPADAPADILWSLTVYDAETASGVDAPGQTYPSLNSMDPIKANDDGTYTIFAGPQRPDEATNWLATVPGRGWFALLRWYGPKQEFFDRHYKPGDFVRIG